MYRIGATFALWLAVVAEMAPAAISASNRPLGAFLRENIGLSQDQINAINGGHAVAKVLPFRTPAEAVLFGRIYSHSAPETYVQLIRDLERLRKLPNYLALGSIAEAAELSYLRGLALDGDDIKSRKKCKPGDCEVQMPANPIDEIQRTVDGRPATPVSK